MPVRVPRPENSLWTPGFVRLCGVGFSYYACVYLLLSVLPLYLARGGLADVTIGALLSLMNAASLVVRPLAGWLSDLRGRRVFIVLGVGGLLIGTAGLPLVGASVALFAALRIVLGLGWGNLTSTANTLAGELVPPARRGEALGLYTMFGSLALAAGPAAGLALVRGHGYTAAFLVATAFAVASLILALTLPRAKRPASISPRLSLSALVSVPALGPAGLAAAQALMYGGLVNFLPLLATRGQLGDPGLFFTIYALLLVVLRRVAGRLSDRHGRAPVIAPGLLFGSAALTLLGIATVRWEMLAAAALFALAMAGVQPPTQAWGLDVAAAGRRGTAMATIVMAQDVGIAGSGVLLGWIATRTDLRTAFLAAGAVGLVALAGLTYAWIAGAVPRPAGTRRAGA